MEACDRNNIKSSYHSEQIVLSYVGATVGSLLIDGINEGLSVGDLETLGTSDGTSVLILGAILTDGTSEIDGANDGGKLGRALMLGASDGCRLGLVDSVGVTEGMEEGSKLLLGWELMEGAVLGLSVSADGAADMDGSAETLGTIEGWELGETLGISLG